MKNYKFTLLALITVLTGIVVFSANTIFYSNIGVSKSFGTIVNGALGNAYRVDYKTPNSKYFSLVSYFLMGNCYVNSKLYHTMLDSYRECENTCKGIKFKVMECSGRKGGNILLHKTHQNGISADFMVPKIRNGKQVKFYDCLGLLHYLLDFDSSGRLIKDKKVSIDFDTMGKHIIALDNAARKNGLKISKVILKIDLKDDLFTTDAGKEIQSRGIYFAKSLPKKVDLMHDDHYHVDFAFK